MTTDLTTSTRPVGDTSTLPMQDQVAVDTLPVSGGSTRPVHTPRVGRRAARKTDPVEVAASRAARLHRDRVADALTAVVAGTAAFSSWTGWVLLGHHAGWPVLTIPGGHQFDTAWLNPLSVDVMAYVALRAWVSPRSSERTRLWGRRAAVGALALSIVGNALGHGLEASGLGQLLLSLGLAGMAPVLLFVVLHLRTLRTDDQRAAVEAARREAQERLEREATQTGGQPPARREAQKKTRSSSAARPRPAKAKTAEPEPELPKPRIEQLPPPARTEQLTPPSSDEQARARARFDELVAANPDVKPSASEIHRELGLTAHEATVRRWVKGWWEEYTRASVAA